MLEKVQDLHIHSIYSDGEYTPEEIFEQVKLSNVKIFSLTDHDTIEGAKRLTSQDNIIYIPGIELTAKTTIGREHILGYDFNLNNSTLNEALRTKKHQDIANFLLYYDTLRKEFGISFPKQDIDIILNKIGNMSRVDLSNLLRKYNYAQNQDEAFDKYLNPIRDKVKNKKQGLTEKECIKMIKNAGGYVSLAHPNSLNPLYKNPSNLSLAYRELKERLIYMKKLGLDAIEIQHSNQSEPFRQMLRTLAKELSLLESGGSDYHGEHIKSGVRIGSGYKGNIHIKNLSLTNHILQNK